MRAYFAEHDDVGIGADARGPALLIIDRQPGLWRVRQILEDPAGDHDWGFDVEAIKKAYELNQHSHRVHGASTISQQVAKNLFLWSGRSYFRKGLEAYFTVLIEACWP